MSERQGVAVEPAGLWTWCDVQSSFRLPRTVSVSRRSCVTIITLVLGQMGMLMLLFRFRYALVGRFRVGTGDLCLPASQALSVVSSTGLLSGVL